MGRRRLPNGQGLATGNLPLAEAPRDLRRTYALFDIDGTLMLSDGAGRAALGRALERAMGIPDPLDGIGFWGRTDRWIVAEAARRAGVTMPLDALADYPNLLRAELQARSPAALPGVRELLSALHSRPGVEMMLATGNLRESARIKLAHMDLDSFFDWSSHGGFGDQHEDRAEMMRALVAMLPMTPSDRVVVIGDTEHDIIAARSAGTAVVAVATGRLAMEELEAAGADVVLPDFTDTDLALDAVLGNAAEG